MMTVSTTIVIEVEQAKVSVLDIEKGTLLPQHEVQEPDSKTLKEISNGLIEHQEPISLQDSGIDDKKPDGETHQVPAKTWSWRVYQRYFWLEIKNNPFLTSVVLFVLLCVIATFYYFII
ncbi:unnamed protein product [Orchesella dallaii]|uniref:Uncharacterized protein n=1 Tax=Orchesella dallaii TaxID=48710 RepID=A0ABP1Q3Y2_9HEXA